MESIIYDFSKARIPPTMWWAIVTALVIVTLFLFPFTSIKNPKKKLKFTIKWMDFSNIHESEPFLTLFLKVDNRSDIKQTITKLTGNVRYSASYEDDNFPEHPIATPFNESQIKIDAKASKIITIRLPLLPESVTRFKKYIEAGEYIFWSGIISANVSAKIWQIERGGQINQYLLPKFPHVPTSRIFEGIEEL